MSIRNKLSSASVQTAIGITLAAVLLWLFFRGSDLGAIWENLATASPVLVLAAVVANLLSHVLRAVRWKVLLRPLGDATLWNCLVMTIIGFMVNFLVPPGRLGEIARPYLLARKEGFSASSAFATIFVERVLDLVTVVLLIGFCLVFTKLPSSSEEVVRGLKIGGIVGLSGAVAGLGVMYVVARDPVAAVRRMERIFRLLPVRVAAAARGFAETFTAGLRVVTDPGSFSSAIVVSILVWLAIAAAFWLGALAIGVDFPYRDTFLVIGFLTIGVAVPTPGGAGGYHYMGALALTMLFGADENAAKAVALVNHAIAFLPVCLIGILLFPGAGGSFGQLKQLQ